MDGFQPTLTDSVAESEVEYTKSEPTHGLVAEKEKIAADGEYNLSGERYRRVQTGHAAAIGSTVDIEMIADVFNGISSKKSAYWNSGRE